VKVVRLSALDTGHLYPQEVFLIKVLLFYVFAEDVRAHSQVHQPVMKQPNKPRATEVKFEIK
jgi:hypothetical protein